MFCEKCEEKDFLKLSEVIMGDLHHVIIWTTYECTKCKLQKLIKKETAGIQWIKK